MKIEPKTKVNVATKKTRETAAEKRLRQLLTKRHVAGGKDRRGDAKAAPNIERAHRAFKEQSGT